MLTKNLFNGIFPTKGLNPQKYNLVRRRDALVDALNKFLPMYGITTYLRVCAFLATCGIETDYFKTSVEYASGADYEGRSNLGNYLTGDGKRFPGRSIIQTTGRFNYWRVVVRMIRKRTGKDWTHPLAYSNFKAYLATEHYTKLLAEADRLNVNFLAHPEMLAEVEIAVEAACIFWEENNLNIYADRGEFKALNGIVNKGDSKKTALHWDKRNALYSLCKRRIPQDFGLLPAPVVTTTAGNSSYTTQTEPSAAPNQAPMLDLPSNKQDAQNQQLAQNDTGAAALQSNKPEDDFLTTAFDRNVSPDVVKSAVPTLATRVWKFLVRPLTLLYALLEAGNIAAWLGVVAAVVIIGLLIYWHRNDIKKLYQTLKKKFIE